MKINTDFIGSTLELSHPAGEMTWKEALNTKWSDGWRMPTRAELIALFHEAEDREHIFNDGAVVWSASSYASGSTVAWYVSFSNGGSFTGYKSKASGVRLVRG